MCVRALQASFKPFWVELALKLNTSAASNKLTPRGSSGLRRSSRTAHTSINPGPKLGGIGECQRVLAKLVAVSCGGRDISASESLASESESESKSETSASAGSSGATCASATAGVVLTPSETDMRCVRLIKYSPPVCVEKKKRTYLRSIVSSSTPNETIETAVRVLT